MTSVDVWHIGNLEITLRIVCAALLGGIIGLEREINNHDAGFRTHILVCIGSATIMVLSIYGFSEFVKETNVRIDPARMAAQVVSGVGFLGAGAILRNGMNISGLTTAASIWVVAGIGLACGAGFYYVGALTTLLSIISLFFLNKWEKKFMKHRRDSEVVVKMLDRPGNLSHLVSHFNSRGIDIKGMQVELEQAGPSGEEQQVMNIHFQLKGRKPENLLKAVEMISSRGDILYIETKAQSAGGRTGSGDKSNSLKG